MKESEVEVKESPAKEKRVKIIKAETLLAMRDRYTQLPPNMKSLDFPHKSKRFKKFREEALNFRDNPDSKFNQFNENVRKLREPIFQYIFDIC